MRKGLWIRLLIYGPIIAFLAWRAFFSDREEAVMEPDPPAATEAMPKTGQSITVDGQNYEVVDVEEFVQSKAPAPKKPETE